MAEKLLLNPNLIDNDGVARATMWSELEWHDDERLA